MIGNLLLLALAMLLVLLNGFFVAAEFALVKLRHTQAVGLAEHHGWRGRLLLNVHGHLDAYLSACQLGITLSSLGLGWVGEPAFAHLLQPLFDVLGLSEEAARLTAFVIAFSVISFLHIVLGELPPSRWRSGDRSACRCGPQRRCTCSTGRCTPRSGCSTPAPTGC